MSADKPLITAIIPTYRRPQLLKRAIRSVLAQSYKNFQLCVYDNASGDETGSVVADFARSDPRVKYHCHPENIGLMGNFNYGMAHVDTPYFSFLSDDDILFPDYFETALEGFNKHPDAMLSAASTIMVSGDRKVLDIPLASWPREGYYPAPDGLFEMTGGSHPIITAILFRREVVDRFGTMDADVGMPADLDLELKVAAHYPIVISKKPCAIFTIHSTSTGGTSDYHYVWPSWLKIMGHIEEDEGLAPDVRARAGRELNEQLLKRLLYLGYKSITVRNFDHGYEISAILRERYKLRIKPAAIVALCGICKSFPPIYYVIDPLNHFRKTAPRRNKADLQKKYGDYLRYLDM